MYVRSVFFEPHWRKKSQCNCASNKNFFQIKNYLAVTRSFNFHLVKLQTMSQLSLCSLASSTAYYLNLISLFDIKRRWTANVNDKNQFSLAWSRSLCFITLRSRYCWLPLCFLLYFSNFQFVQKICDWAWIHNRRTKGHVSAVDWVWCFDFIRKTPTVPARFGSNKKLKKPTTSNWHAKTIKKFFLTP